MILLHNYDIALLRHRPAQQDTFRCCYIGTPSVSYFPPSISDRIEIISAMGKEGWHEALEKISDYSFHYCLRLPQTNQRLVKPFTKGFVAAKVGAPIIVNRETDDAEEMLGSDYPYLVEGLHERSIVEMLLKAEDDFGGMTWHFAKKRMHAIANGVAPHALAAQLDEILKFLTE